MSFGRRLALFIVLIALVPALALVALLLIVSADSSRGKADARIAAGVDTAVALYQGHVADASLAADGLGEDARLARALAAGDRTALRDLAGEAADTRGVTAFEVFGPGGERLVDPGRPDAIAFASADIPGEDGTAGTLRVSTTTAPAYETEVRRLTKRRLVVERDGVALAGTPPDDEVEAGETTDVELEGNEFRGRLVELDGAGGETLLLLGPRREGGFLGIEVPTAALLFGLLLLGMILAYALARTLTGLHAQVAEQAVTDPLTGLWNRRRMFEILDRELERANRFGHELSVLIIDIDDFKQINDRYGHPQGDATLRAIADTIRDATRSIDEGARYGGDELALLMLETGTEGGLVVAERLRSLVEALELPLPEGGKMRITISLGLATMPAAALDPASLIEAADQALLEAKREGKDRVGVAPELPPSARPEKPGARASAAGGNRRRRAGD